MKYTISSAQQIEDSKTIIKTVLDLNIHHDMKRKVIDYLLWNITGAFGKFNTKYISDGAKISHGELLNHEHVFTKKGLIQRILAEPDNLETILKDAIGCIVTKEEHDRLNKEKNVEGWQRYINAKIKVWELNEDILYRKLDEMKNREFMKLPFDLREKIFSIKPAKPFDYNMPNNEQV
ncbi:MAG: hypothetical protein P4L27_12250 [Ignavibacteriaceae bacterium]|nr:hypothetical protein [Ignavibacteriaceae bacterium]